MDFQGILNDWPFRRDGVKGVPYSPKNKIETLGYKIVFEGLNWRSAHQEAYRFYYENHDFYNFAKEIQVLLSQYPYKLDYYNFAAEKLLSKKQYDLASIFIKKEPELALMPSQQNG